MNLILWRHAEAEDISADGSDASRCLTRHGEQQARKMAAWLNPHLPADARVLASPAKRTRQTAAALNRHYEIEERLFTLASVDDYLAVCQTARAGETLVLVGHQPTLGQLAATLLCGESQDWSVRKGAIWWLHGRTRGAHQQLVLKAMLAPELL